MPRKMNTQQSESQLAHLNVPKLISAQYSFTAWVHVAYSVTQYLL